MFLHRFDVEDGERRIDRVDLALHGIDQRGGVAFVAGHDGVAISRGVWGDELVDGAVEDGALVFADGARLGVLDDADDLVGDAGSVDDMANGVLALEVTADELFVADGDRGGGGVLFVEVASGDAWDAEGGE
jgi:hypothetical protein